MFFTPAVLKYGHLHYLLNQLMPILSKYTNQEVEDIVDQLIAVLSEKNSPVDLSLMCLGNTITHILKEHTPEGKRQAIAENFAKALVDSVK